MSEHKYLMIKVRASYILIECIQEYFLPVLVMFFLTPYISVSLHVSSQYSMCVRSIYAESMCKLQTFKAPQESLLCSIGFTLMNRLVFTMIQTQPVRNYSSNHDGFCPTVMSNGLPIWV